MSARLLEGKVVAAAVMEDVTARVAALKERGVTPGLGTILVGDDPASAGYVRKKHEACEESGIASFHIQLPEDGKQADLLDAVASFNANPEVHGYLLQHPVPRNYDFNAAMLTIDPAKDADGLHPVNLGKLVLQDPGPLPCTPAGIQRMLAHYEIPVAGKEVVIVGRGPTLGRPLGLILSMKAEAGDAAVTTVHSRVPDISVFTRRADILVAAVGVHGIIQPDMVKPGAVVISGGISWEGRKLLPDADPACAEVASWITPRIGGVGPTTIAMLLRNMVAAAEASLDQA